MNVANICYIPSNLTTGVTSSIGWPHAQYYYCVERERDFFLRPCPNGRPSSLELLAAYWAILSTLIEANTPSIS